MKGANPPPSQNDQRYNSTPQKSNRLIFVSILSFLWAIAAISMGFYYMVAADAIVEETLIILDDMGYVINFDLAQLIIIFGALMLSSGILAAVTGVFSLLKRFYVVALVTCILSAALAMIFIVGFFGLIVAFFIYKSKDEFTDNRVL
jgi:magnesium-transporting ATPase (P-type)